MFIFRENARAKSQPMSVDDVVPQMERGSVIPIGRFHDTLLLDLHHQRINLRSHMVSLVNPDLIKSHTHRLGLSSVLPLLKLKRVSSIDRDTFDN